MDSNDLIVLLEKLRAGVLAGDASAKKEALRISKKLTLSLEDPFNVAADAVFWPMLTLATRITVDLNLFGLIINHGPVSSTKLAALSGAEELLIVRVLRLMAAADFIKEVELQTWEATPVTDAMASEGMMAGHRVIGEFIAGAGQKAPKYLREAGYRCPTDSKDGFMQYAHNTKLNVFDFFAATPGAQHNFNLFMGHTMGARASWVDWYPVKTRLLAGADADAALLVDVGGGRGHDVLAFHAKYPGCGRLVLQDLGVVADPLQDMDPAVECMAYDFFTEQPVQGARAYFYHHILHDWSDTACLAILERVKQAMRPGYSKLLLHEMLVPEDDAPLFNGLLDMTMMCFNAGMERSGLQWYELLRRAGLRVDRLWGPPVDGADGIIEAVLEVD